MPSGTYHPFTLALTALTSLAALSPEPAHAIVTYRTVALTGEQAPGAEPGVVFSSIRSPGLVVINDAGQTAFLANLAGAGVTDANDSVIYVERDGLLVQLAREGDQAPNADPGVLIKEIDNYPKINTDGQVLFRASLTGNGVNSSNDVALYGDVGSSLAQIAREGQQVPDAAPGIVFVNFGFPRLNAMGQSMFRATITGGSALYREMGGDTVTDR